MAAGTPIEGSANVCDGTLASERGSPGCGAESSIARVPRQPFWRGERRPHLTAPNRYEGTSKPRLRTFDPGDDRGEHPCGIAALPKPDRCLPGPPSAGQ